MSDNQNQYIHGYGEGYNNQQYNRNYPNYPGMPNLGPGGAPFGSQLPALIPQQSLVPIPPPSQAGGGGLGGMLGNLNLSNFNFKDIKGIIDRMGGVEGVVSTMGKVQKIMSSVQQMQPMFKLLMSTFSKAKTADDKDDLVPRRRRRRRRRRSSSRPLNLTKSKRRPRR